MASDKQYTEPGGQVVGQVSHCEGVEKQQQRTRRRDSMSERRYRVGKSQVGNKSGIIYQELLTRH